MTEPVSSLPAPSSPLRIAVVGAGPAGIYASDALMKSDTPVSIDLFEKMPAPFGLIRYGVAPDHPRIKGIIQSLHKVLDKPQIRLIGHVEFGKDIDLAWLAQHYHAVIFSTGAVKDRLLDLPGIDLDGSYGAADFVAWYDGNPDFPRTWPLTAQKVAVLGVGNVALDVARVLAKTAEDLLSTEIPPNVHAGLLENPAKEVHVFGRRGPAQAKFTPLELKELDHCQTIEVIVDPEDIDYDEGSERARRESKITDQVASIVEAWAIRDPGERPHKLHLHFFESPTEILGQDGKVAGLRTERTALTGDGNVQGTGKFTDWEVGAVYRAVGYLSDPLPGIPFDQEAGVIPNEAGRVQGEDGTVIPAVFTTGWVKRGPIGLIGNTKGDANETVACLVSDFAEGKLWNPQSPSLESVDQYFADKGHEYTTWEGWYRLDEHERGLGEPHGRERVKVVEREDMLAASREKQG